MNHVETQKYFFLAVVLAAFFAFIPKAVLAECTDPGAAYVGTCDTEGEAAQICVAGDSAEPNDWCICGESVCECTNCNPASLPTNNTYRWTWNTSCDEMPEFSGTSETECLIDTVYCDPIELCSYQSNGGMCSSDGGVLQWSVTNYSPTGNWCLSPSDPVANVPDGCTVVGGVITCDCVANPAAPYCPGGDYANDCIDDGQGGVICTESTSGGGDSSSGGGDNDSGGSDSDQSGGNTGTGDGDPDTAGDGAGGDPDDSTGTGDGDVDGDGDRDVDCNPFSNPDCAFSGSASAKAQCGTPPTCTHSDPVQCAQLVQQYNIMCAILNDQDGDGSDNTVGEYSDCSSPPPCTSENPVECAALVQSWSLACDTFVGTSGDPSLDEDFGRDLKTEADEFDASTMIDETGFISSASCPAPQVVSVLGASVNVSFQSMCDLAAVLRPLLIAASMLIGYMIIGGKK
jgi:hypothetical protein